MREYGLQHSLIAAIAVVREHELQRSWKRQWWSPSKTVWAQMLVVFSAQPHIGGVKIVGGHLGVDSILAGKIKMSVALKLRLREGNASKTVTGYPKSQSLNSNLILVARMITTRYPILLLVPQKKTWGPGRKENGWEEGIGGTIVVEEKERGLVTVCDKSVLLHEDFVLSSFPRTTSSSIIRAPSVRAGSRGC